MGFQVGFQRLLCDSLASHLIRGTFNTIASAWCQRISSFCCGSLLGCWFLARHHLLKAEHDPNARNPQAVINSWYCHWGCFAKPPASSTFAPMLPGHRDGGTNMSSRLRSQEMQTRRLICVAALWLIVVLNVVWGSKRQLCGASSEIMWNQAGWLICMSVCGRTCVFSLPCWPCARTSISLRHLWTFQNVTALCYLRPSWTHFEGWLCSCSCLLIICGLEHVHVSHLNSQISAIRYMWGFYCSHFFFNPVAKAVILKLNQHQDGNFIRSLLFTQY